MKLYNLPFVGVLLIVLSQIAVDCTAIIESVQPTPPIAVISAPPSVEAGKSVVFDGSASYHPQGLRIISWEWTFPDGQIKEGATVSHTFWDYGWWSVVLRVTDERGISGTANYSIEVLNPPPAAIADSSKFRVRRGEIVTFSASRSYDQASAQDQAIVIEPKKGGQIVSWQWEFRHERDIYPERILWGEIVQYVFGMLGRYEVKLTVTDRGGATNTTDIGVEVFNIPPQANFQWQIGCGLERLSRGKSQAIVPVGEVLLDGALSKDPDGWIIKWEWRVDNAFFSGPKICAILESGRFHQVDLWVTDNDGTTSSVSQLIKP